MSGEHADADVAARVAETELAEPFALREGPLFRQGDVADSMYVISEGEVQVVARTAGDDVVPLGLLGAGAVLGELSLIDHGVRSASALVTRPTTGLRLTRGAFQMLRAARKPVSAALLAHLAAMTCARIRVRVGDLVAALDGAPAPAFAVTPEVDRRRWHPADPVRLDPRTAALLPFLQPLSEPQRTALLEAGTTWSVARGERLALAGQPSTEALVVLRGAVASSVAKDGRSERCGLAGPGRLPSTVAAMDGGPLALDAAAREATVVLALPTEVLARLRQQGDELAYRLEDVLMRELVHELRVLSGQVARLAAHGRLAGRAP